MKTCVSLLIAAAIIGLSAGPVVAQSRDPGQDDHGRSHQQQDRHQGKHHGKYGRRDDLHFPGMHDRGIHEGWYKRGGHMPEEFRSGRYEVNDWHAEHLRQPPRGYRWIRSDNGDFLLVAVTTGLITDLLLHH
ncbi:MAG: RcnB family protein [Pseudomonadota bacterium]|nr:RcnB family protein [Pseudomonadota bacterium]